MATEKDPPTSLVAVRDARERAISVLSDAFARDDLDMDEFERRLGIAHRTEALVELEQLTKDLAAVEKTPAATTALVTQPQPQPAALAHARDRQSLVAILSGTQRAGYWRPARQVRVVAVLGGSELDFREAVLPAGVTEVQVSVCMGGVNIIVPPQLAVEMEGVAIMGGFAQSERVAPHPDPERPILRVTGFAIMGGVHIETRLMGESEHDAHRRLRDSRRERRRLERGRRPAALPAHRDE